MKPKTTTQINAYRLDITKTDKVGAFSCPNCKTRISPDDSSETVYSIYSVALNDNNLNELMLYC